MTHRAALRDAARILLPFSVFVGLFSHGAVSAVGFVLCALCVWSELKNGLRARPATSELEGASS